jgi:hypothetical protein
MVDNELFYTLAEIAIALAGFAGIAAGITGGGVGGLTSEERTTLWYLIIDCLIVLFMSFLPVLLFHSNWVEAEVWSLSVLILGIIHFVVALPGLVYILRNWKDIREAWRPIISPIQISTVFWAPTVSLILIMASFNVFFTPTQTIFAFGLIIFLLFASIHFLFLVADERRV